MQRTLGSDTKRQIQSHATYGLEILTVGLPSTPPIRHEVDVFTFVTAQICKYCPKILLLALVFSLSTTQLPICCKQAHEIISIVSVKHSSSVISASRIQNVEPL